MQNIIMKKYISLFLSILILTASVVSCGNNTSDEDGNASVKSDPPIESHNSIDKNEDSTSGESAPVGDNSADSEASAPSNSESVPPSDESTPIEDESKTEAYKPQGGEFSFPNGLLILNDRCMESFGGSYDNANLYYQYVTEHKTKLGDDVNVFSLVVPTASSIYLQEVVIDGKDFYASYGGDQVKKLSYLDDLFAKDGDVVSVNVYDELFKHWNEEIYFRTDWHWTQLGAYYAAQVFAKSAGYEMEKLNSGYYKEVIKSADDGTQLGFLGSLYASTDRPKVLADNPDRFFWYEFNHEYTVDYYDRETGTTLKRTRNTCYPTISNEYVSSWYMTFLDADNNVCKINTGNKNGKVAVVFKDSFGNCFAPMLMSMYETIYTVDFRYFTQNSVEFCQNVGATDVLFVMSSFSAMGSNCLNIGRMARR